MLELTLIRHAKSSWDDPSLDDFDRPLNNRGLRNAPLMGKVLAERGVSFDLMVSSTAARAMTTAKLIAAEIDYAQEDIMTAGSLYEASVDRLLECVHAIDPQYRCVALIGHNPGMTDFCAYLCKRCSGHFPTGAIATVAFQLDDWQAVARDSGRLALFEYPRKYTG
jgi:phosphohistidine phosphatase